MPTLAFDILRNRRVVDTVWHTCPLKKTRAQLEAEVYASCARDYPPDIKVRLASALQYRFIDVEGDYGHGWECVTSETSWRNAVDERKAYRENEPGIKFRLRERRVSIWTTTY